MFRAYSDGYRNQGHVGDTVTEACVAKIPTVRTIGTLSPLQYLSEINKKPLTLSIEESDRTF